MVEPLDRQTLRHFASKRQDNARRLRQETAVDVSKAVVIMKNKNIKIFVKAKFIFLKKKKLIQKYKYEINGLFYRRKSEYSLSLLTMTHVLHMNNK